MTRYIKQSRILVAVDCIIFGFDGYELKLLLIKRGFEPEKNKWSLMGGFVQSDEKPEDAASRVLKQLTGLENVYMEQLLVFGKPNRDPIERTVSITYFALIDIKKYEKQLSDDYRAEWFPLNRVPKLIFDHDEMVQNAKNKLRYKAALHPILFELLPEKFTIPQIMTLYEQVYDVELDKRNFTRKLRSTGLLIKQLDKDKENSKKGAFYYKLDKATYKEKFTKFLNFVSNPEY
ncbi:NUDIX hydrolase [Parapedobacter sp. ISTM3]|uniref:ADP-ribose pyrophosphatase YjhB, NUDIX family n=1 Tax=Parapedobacter luteus TaxID=623280 RepID=A0A1T5EKT3_9SPHI|nr:MULTISPECIES: NUDIX domain-containing protein [Parapedobacter]MBK1441361.1 NUDIX hydrolase [Parapedobacter sp. ISTM3]SKB84358.1 ADP-ribose pyrophosphatase YjhB, NUDIX family [Parapedobacter luteus]